MSRAASFSLFLILLGLFPGAGVALHDQFSVVPLDLVASTVPAEYLWTRIGDINGDGLNELIVVDSRTGIVRIVRVAGDGTWTLLDLIQLPPIPWPAREYVSPQITDFDGDGRLDLAVLERGNNQFPAVHILLNQGSGFSQSSYPLASADSGYNMAAGDLDGDGFPEIVTCSLGVAATPMVQVHWSSGIAGNLFSTSNVSALSMDGSWAVTVYVGDADGDGQLDIGATSAQGGPAINGRIFLNRGGRVFDFIDLPTATGPRSTHLAFGDVTGDGRPDIVTDSHVPSGDGYVLHLYAGTGAGFAPPVQISGGDPRPLAPLLADFDQDGHLDIVFDRTVQGQIGFLSGIAGGVDSSVQVISDPTLSSADHAAGTNVDTLAVGDLDNDGDLDVVFGGSKVVWLRNGSSSNRAPVANAGSDQELTAGSACTAEATLDGSSSTDPDGDPLSYLWHWDGHSFEGQRVTTSLGLGDHEFALEVTDPSGANSSDLAVVRVIDRTAPAITQISASPAILWPPNHRMVRVRIAAAAEDACSAVSCSIVGVTSTEPVNGLGDGDTSPDWQIIDASQVDLRAERSGSGSGRSYSVAIRCTDTNGNTALGSVEVRVPKSQKG